MTRLRVGACLSLSGRYARFGRQAAAGLATWQTLTEHAVGVTVEDDASDPDRVGNALRGLARRSDLLLGPYSTQLMRVAAHTLGDLDALLFNHGGAGDDVQALHPGRIVSILAPTSRYAEPFVQRIAATSPHAALRVVRGPGSFARQIAAGAVRQAGQLGLGVEERGIEDGDRHAPAAVPWSLLSVGRFEDDIEIVGRAQRAANPPATVCSIAAGVAAFLAEAVRCDGVYGIAQWFPATHPAPEIGPAEPAFIAAYRQTVGAWPDYPAVQAAAAAELAVRCVELAGSLDPDALWSAARNLRTTTLFGAFGIDPRTGAQLHHRPVLLRWQAGRLRPATATLLPG